LKQFSLALKRFILSNSLYSLEEYFDTNWKWVLFCYTGYSAVLLYRLQCCSAIPVTVLFCYTIYSAVLLYRLQCCSVIQVTVLFCYTSYTVVLL
jgi:hypothetical protein